MSDSSKSPASGSVFISYAHEDSDAARCIAEALRDSGLQVWMDQSELRGGVAWDESIRRQIQTCTLFLPIVSARTQARREGYFRREWRLAAERTHDMADGLPFLIPVVADDTSEAQAFAPAEFFQVQWTRLPDGRPTVQFCEQVKRLLAQALAPDNADSFRRSTALASARASAASGPAPRHSIPGWVWAVVPVLVVGFSLVYLTFRSPAPARSRSPRPVAGEATASSQAVADKSLAVLPFDSLSPDKANEFFADGIHEELLNSLQNVHELRVVSRTSVMEYRNRKKKIRQVAEELGVAYVLEGSVRRVGNRVRVSAQLIDARTDARLWSLKPFDRNLTDVFLIQSEAAEAISAALQVALSPQVRSLLQRRPTSNPTAYDFYLKGREITHGLRPDWAAAEKMFQAAVQIDPDFAAAWGQLCYVCAYRYFLLPEETHRTTAARAMSQTERLAAGSPDAIQAAGYYHYYGLREFPQAAEQFEKLLHLQPNASEALRVLANIRRRQGQWLEALVFFRRIAQIDPGYLYSAQQYRTTLSAGRRYEEARAEQRRIVSLQPEDLRQAFELALISFYAHGSTAEAESLLARLPELESNSDASIGIRKRLAILTGTTAEFDRLMKLRPSVVPARTEASGRHSVEMAVLLATNGDPDGARAALEDRPAEIRRQLQSAPSAFRLWTALGEVEAVLGHRDEALAAAARAVELMPESKDALDGPVASCSRAFVHAWVGDKEGALAEYARLLRAPFSSLNVHEMKHDPWYAPLQGDPRFEALLSDPVNNAPLF